MSKNFQITKTINSSDLSWNKIILILQRRYGFSKIHAGLALEKFYREVSETLATRWMVRPTINKDEQAVLCALAEAHGCDVLCINREWHSDLFHTHYNHEVTFAPFLGDKKKNNEYPSTLRGVKLSLRIFNLTWKADSISSAIPIYALLLLIGILGIFPLFFLLSYCLSVLFVFISSPAKATLTATRSFPFWLVLISALTIIAALFGGLTRKAIKMVYMVVRK